MQPDWIMGLLGGLLIGLGGAAYLIGSGRIMGASGIIGGLVDGSGRSNALERIVFLAGVFLMPIVLTPFYKAVDTHITDNLTVLVAAGLFVGVGTRMANGCTSGHGVCGLARFSARSAVAVLVFMVVAMITVFVVRHVI